MLKQIIQSFLPWILYFIIKNKTQLSLEIAVIAALSTSIIFEIKSLKKGFVLSWGTLIYFIFLTVAVVFLQNKWVIEHEWIFSTGTLALICWISILIRKPFTIQYAKETVEKEKWTHPLFFRINYILSVLWGFIFLFHLVVQILHTYFYFSNSIIMNILSYGTTVIGIWVSMWFPDWYKQRHIRITKS